MLSAVHQQLQSRFVNLAVKCNRYQMFQSRAPRPKLNSQCLRHTLFSSRVEAASRRLVGRICSFTLFVCSGLVY